MSVDDKLLGTLAERAGLSTRWEDAFGKEHAVAPDNLQAVLGALGFEARSDGDARALIDAMEREDAALPPRVTGDAGGELVLPVRPGAWRMRDEQGGISSGTAAARDGGACVDAACRARLLPAGNRRARDKRRGGTAALLRDRGRVRSAGTRTGPCAAWLGTGAAALCPAPSGRRRRGRLCGTGGVRAGSGRARGVGGVDQPGARAVLRRSGPVQPVRAVEPHHAQRAARRGRGSGRGSGAAGNAGPGGLAGGGTRPAVAAAAGVRCQGGESGRGG